MKNVTHTHALIDPTATYRYFLCRSWAKVPEAFALFVMLNPSTADAKEDDATVRKCIGFAKHYGLCGIQIVNLFGLRSRAPQALMSATDPIGPETDKILYHVARGDMGFPRPRFGICAWGSCGGPGVAKRVRARIPAVLPLLGDLALHCLGLTEEGMPRHPLMLAYKTELEPWPGID